jgi:hypothetical protein
MCWFKTNTGVRKGSVLSPVLFYPMMDEIANEVRRENKRPHMKTLFLDILLVWGKDRKEI